MPIPLLLALALPVQDASALEPVPFERAPDEVAPAAPTTNDEFAVPELQESAVPS